MSENAEFELMPVDVRAQEFRKMMWGYSPDEVEDFKERLARELERHVREKGQLEDRLAGFREQLKAFRERETAMNDALVAAQALKAQTEEVAQREAKLVVREAGVEADTIGGRALKAANDSVLVVAVEPATSPLLSGGRAGDHGIVGIGADFVPSILDRDIIDEVVTVTTQEAIETTLRLSREMGLLVGISSGANVAAALRIAQRLGEGKVVVTVLPDTGERYPNLTQ
ncbi:MAG: pyridoxal-phosphate dependent enzyme [Chloroflexi bacterium]|nr:pyridoxal-phosphate dependent enzyme [Chloroflexota bacterium]